MDPEKFGTFIQSRRKELGMKQADLAAKLDVTDKAVSRWERGVGFPDIKLLEPLANALELTLTELMQMRLIDKPLPKEEADTLLSETAQIIEVQKKLSWKRKLILFIGRAAIGAAAALLVYVSHNTPWEPDWLGRIVYIIAFAGLWIGNRMLEYIIKQLYLQKRPYGIWHSVHTWVWVGLVILGFKITISLELKSTTTGYVLSLLIGFALIIGAVFYYAYHEDDINGNIDSSP